MHTNPLQSCEQNTEFANKRGVLQLDRPGHKYTNNTPTGTTRVNLDGILQATNMDLIPGGRS